MIFMNVGKPTQLKKVIYLIASIILGLLLSFIAHALIEIGYLRWVLNQGQLAPFYGGCALAPWFQAALWASGIIGGFILGRFWWRKIYIERVWLKKH